MKIAIVSGFRRQTVNYGNNLQAYALNRYLRKRYPACETETLWFPEPVKKHITSYVGLTCKRAVTCLKNLCHGYLKKKTRLADQVQNRMKTFERFQTRITQKAMTWERLPASDYDIFIVGSDVVWAQYRCFVNRIVFLDFTARKKFTKIAYAASFGCDQIPKENRRFLKKCLDDFDGISCREASAVQMLRAYGISEAVHVMDPTLLLPAEEWVQMERKPADMLPGPYVFVYLLGADRTQRENVTGWCAQNGSPIVTIPYASGEQNDVDAAFGDVQCMDCSPEEWLWLIHHAEYVITDSFHGAVFSTIFEKRFFAVSRQYTTDINARLRDFLQTIRQQDKLISNGAFGPPETYVWDYERIRRILADKIEASEEFLRKAITS